MISLCYMLSFLLNDGKIKNLDFDQDMGQIEAFNYVREAKRRHTLGDLCYENAECLMKFAVRVFSL